MTQLQLDGAKFDIETREMTYELPAPFGPKKGPAFVKIIARPASAQNSAFKAKLDKLLNDAKVKDLVRNKRYQERDDVDEFIESGNEDARKVNRAVMALNYDECIESWETDIQNDGKNLEPTRENFLSLSEFAHPQVAKFFARLKADLTDFTKWQNIAEFEVEGEDLGNSSSS